MIHHRPVLPFRPHWSGEIQGYAYNSTRRYWPTLRAWYEWEDLTQEAYLVYMMCDRRYRGRVDNGAWFMALYKSSWHNKLVDLVVRVPQYSLGQSAELWEPAAPDIVRELWEIYRGLPQELQVVLIDVCRLKPRFHFSKRAIRELRVAMAANS